MTAEHPDTDIVTGGYRAAQQLFFTATQLVETVARMRQAADTRRADSARAAAGDTQRGDEARRRTDRAVYTAAAAPGWRRDAAPVDLLTAWAAATTWAAHDPRAAAVMLHTEDEMRTRWPQLVDHYDRLRVADGPHPAAAMTAALTHAADTGWDPAVTASPTLDPRGETATATVTATYATTPPAAAPTPAPTPAAGGFGEEVPRPAAVNPAAQALRWIPAAGTPAATTPTATRSHPDRTAATRAPAPAPAPHRAH